MTEAKTKVTGEIDPSTRKIDKLVRQITEGDIKVPAFQRGFAWDQDQITKLLDSIYWNYPIGSILLWHTSEKLKSSRNIGGLKLPDRGETYPVNYVLDGQQRLSSIYAVFCFNREFEEDNGDYQGDPKAFEIAFRFDDESFIPLSATVPNVPYIELKCLLDTEAFFDALENMNPENRKLAKDLHSRINNYEVPVITISKRTKTEVGLIFERINSTGTKLTTLDLLVAWTWSEDFHLKEEFSSLRSVLESKGFGDLGDKILLQCIGAILADDARTKTILSLDPGNVRSKFPQVIASVVAAIDFLSAEFSMKTIDFLPHVHQIVALAYFYNGVKNPNATQITILKKWFWKTAFSRRYSAQTDDKVNADIVFMKRLINKENIRVDFYYTTHLTAEELLKLKFSKSHPYTRALLLMLGQRSPLNLTNGAIIDIGDALSSFNKKEYHHVFPQAFLKTRGTQADKINSLCNFCFLPAGSNKKISNKKPSVYFSELIPQEKKREILDSQLLPLRSEIYSDDNYDEFLSQRANAICLYFDSLVLD